MSLLFISSLLTGVSVSASIKNEMFRHQLARAPLIIGLRKPDDITDFAHHRNGKFINNVFVPAESTVSIAVNEQKKGMVTVTKTLRRKARSKHSRDESLDQHYQDQEQQGPVYYLAEEPDSLHNDRSPYSFEPASGPGQSLESILSRKDSSSQPARVLTASNEDFIIKDHTYQMCPTCPTFSIPIPIPKASVSSSPDIINPYNSDPGYQHKKQQSVIQRIGAFLDNAKDSLVNMMSSQVEASTGFQNRLAGSDGSANVGISPVSLAGLAAIGLGVITALSLGGGSSGRRFGQADQALDITINMLHDIDYNTSDFLCYPRNYCEKFKRKKYMIDQYPLIKNVGARLAELIWDRDFVSERGSGSLCNLRECVFSLFR